MSDSNLPSSEDRLEKVVRAKDRLKKFQAKKKLNNNNNETIIDSIDSNLKINHQVDDHDLNQNQDKEDELKAVKDQEIQSKLKDLNLDSIPINSNQSHQETINLLVNEKNSLKIQIEDYQNQINQLNDSIFEIKKSSNDQVENLNHDLSQTHSSLNQLQSDLNQSNQLINQLRTQLDQSQSQIQILNQSNLNNKNDLIQELQDKLRMKQHNSDLLESELSKLKNLIKSHDDLQLGHNQTIENLNDQIFKLNNQLTQANQRIDLLNNTLDTLQNSNHQSQSDLSQTKNQLDHSLETINTLQAQSDSLNSQLSQLQISHTSLSSQLLPLEQKLSESISHKASLQIDNQNLLENLQELRPKIVELTNQKLQSSERLEEFRQIVRERENELVTMREELSNQRQTQNNEKELFNQEKSHLLNQINQIKLESDQLKLDLEQKVQVIKLDLDSHLHQLQQTQTEFNQLTIQLQTSQSELKESKRQLDLLSDGKSQVVTQLTKKTKALDDLIIQKQQLDLQLESALKNSSFESQRRQELESQNQNLQIDLQKLKEVTLTNLQNQLTQANQKLDQQKSQCDQQENHVKTLQAQNTQLSHSLSEANQQSESCQNQINEITHRLSDANKSLDLQKIQYNQLSKTVQDLQVQKAELDNFLKDSKSTIESLTMQLQQTKKEQQLQIDQASKESDEWSKRVKELENKSGDLLSKLTEITKERDEMLENKLSLEARYSSSQASVIELQNVLELAKTSNEEFKIEAQKEKSHLETLARTLESEKAQKDSLIQDLQKINQDLKSQLQTTDENLGLISNQRQKLQDDLEKCQSELTEQRQSLSSALHDLVTEKNNTEQVERQLNEANDDIEKLENLQNALQADFKSYQDKTTQTVDQMQKEILEFKTKLDLQEEKFNQSEQRCSELKEEIAQLELEKSGLIKEMEEGKEGENRILEKSRSEILELKQKVQLSKEECELVKQDLIQTKAEFEQNDRVKESEIHQLHEQLKELKCSETVLKNNAEKIRSERDDGLKKFLESDRSRLELETVKTELENSLEELKERLESQTLEYSNKLADLATQLAQNKQNQEVELARALEGRQAMELELSKREKELDDLQLTFSNSETDHQQALEASKNKTLKIEKELESTKLLELKLRKEVEIVKRKAEGDFERAQELSETLAAKDKKINETRMVLDSKEEELRLTKVKVEELIREQEGNETRMKVLSENLLLEKEELKKEFEAQLVSEREEKIDQDYLDSILQQHQIDLSTARSQIRSLENKLFEEESRSHEMLTRIESLQDQLRGAEGNLKKGKQLTGSDSNAPLTNSITQLNNSSLLFSQMIDESSLSAETRHHRRESLNCLKTRMEKELGLKNFKNLNNNFIRHQHHHQLDKVTENEMESQNEESEIANQLINNSILRVPIITSKLGNDLIWCENCSGDLFVI
ncbi:hypothetical protein O181_017896 [Austropuccinia psidii MF-1]|uniref:Uncharacterized protein n=1 Tax=Austropuccinia psidii MF-1 TaxID=1389203 RepID=A0A9Q3GSE6_9BASI|nr:hypothetical protein [Austropuccinia psidii MF-1]